MIKENISQAIIDNMTSPIRRIEGKAELFGSSAATHEGNVITINDVCPKPHEAHIQLKSKNLFNVDAVVSNTRVINNHDGTLTIIAPAGSSGTDAAHPKLLSDYAPLLEVGKTYTLSAETTAIANKQIYLIGSKYAWKYGTPHTITQAELDNGVYFYATEGGATCTISNIQIEEGTTATSYAPYMYYPKEDETNIFDTDSIVIGAIGYSNGAEVNNNTYLRTGYYKIEPNTKYYYDIGTLAFNSAHVYDSNKVWVSRADTTNGTIKTPDNVSYLRLTFRKADSTEITEDELAAIKQQPLCISKTNAFIYLKDFSGVKIYGSGKNLWDAAKHNNRLHGGGTRIVTDYIKVAKNTDYVISVDGSTNTHWQVKGFTEKQMTDNSINYIWNNGANLGGDRYYFNSGEYEYVAFRTWKTMAEYGVTENSQYQLELGRTATEYEPYKEPIEVQASADGKATIPSLAPTMALVNNYGLPMVVNCLRAAKITYSSKDALKSFKLERAGENKFFGYGISTKATISLLDKERKINPNSDNYYSLLLGNDGEYVNPFPFMYLDSYTRDEVTNDLTITAYDAIYAAAAHTVSEINLNSYTIREFAAAIAEILNVGFSVIGVEDGSFDTMYEDGANYGGTESLREALNDVAEATQTIYFIQGDKLTFKRLSNAEAAALTIGKSDYFELQNKEQVTISGVCSATELGDNIEAKYDEKFVSGSWIWNEELNYDFVDTTPINFTSEGRAFNTIYASPGTMFLFYQHTETSDGLSAYSGMDENEDGKFDGWGVMDYNARGRVIDFGAEPQKLTPALYNYLMANATPNGTGAIVGVEGITQYARDNPFWELREDAADLVSKAANAIGGLTIGQFDCSWRGNFLLEIGDKIELVTKDNEVITSFFVDDALEYTGALKQSTKFEYTDEEESVNNPTSLGEVIKQTFARVDKANKEITILASETEQNQESISTLFINTATINASVREVETNTNARLQSVNDSIETLTNQVSASMTADAVKIEIQKELDNGVDKVVTNTGFKFDDEGLEVSKSGSEMTTRITEDGMIVYQSEEAVLEANNTGVKAKNLHATTYLIIGNNSRLEDYGTSRTGCFWIG